MSAERFDRIYGYRHVKRAFEVAITGNHTICLMNIGNTPAVQQFANIARENGIPCTVLRRCPCGNLGSVEFDCTCTDEAITTHRLGHEYRSAMDSDIFMEVGVTSSGGYGEFDAIIYARIDAGKAAPMPSNDLSRTYMSLLESATRMLELNESQVKRAQAVAVTIARLAKSKIVHPAHLAESIQYRARKEG